MDEKVIFERVKTVCSMAKDAGIADYKSQAKSADSIRSYDRIWKRAVANGEWLDKVSRASFPIHKSALRAKLAEEYRRLMRLQDMSVKLGNLEAAEKAIREAEAVVQRWKFVNQAVRPTERQKSRSKRLKVPKSSDWQMDTYEACRNDLERGLVTVMWATGCRPKEIEQGIAIRSCEDGIEVTVLGAKVSETTQAGQPERTLTVSNHTTAGMLLEEFNGQTLSMDRKKLENALVKIGRKAKLKHRLSGYTFRHQAGSDSKAAGDIEMTAKVLGHASAKSQKRYGHPNQAKGGAVVKATATVPVRWLDMPRGFTPQPNVAKEY